uniref:START domain-containing protein n=1 Tax=Aegilops tauschii subsp. strangulata TaxID=200361 RepID=A0A453N3T7_AEGTS
GVRAVGGGEGAGAADGMGRGLRDGAARGAALGGGPRRPPARLGLAPALGRRHRRPRRRPAAARHARLLEGPAPRPHPRPSRLPRRRAAAGAGAGGRRGFPARVRCLAGPRDMANEDLAVGKADLVNLWRLVEGNDGGPAWIKMMEKALPNMTYQAWRRDPQNGPPQYQSSTIFENATPDEVRDFFGDDEFRMSNKWDDMLISHQTLEECQTTGTMKVHWVRKFPFFCSDREYIIARRIWKLGSAYYCVTKGVPCSSIPRRSKPRRVDLYYSSWCIRAVESRRGNGGSTACEILLFHHEDMGIPYEIAKIGIRQGMWGCVKRIEPGLRAYQKARAAGEPPSPSALMARINTKVGDNFVRGLESNSDQDIMEAEEKPVKNRMARFLVLGGAVALACTLDQGLLTKALIFGVARRFVGQRNTL